MITNWEVSVALSETSFLLVAKSTSWCLQNGDVYKGDVCKKNWFWHNVSKVKWWLLPLFGGKHFLLSLWVEVNKFFRVVGIVRGPPLVLLCQWESQKAVEFGRRQLRSNNQQGAGHMGQISKVWIIWESNSLGDCNYNGKLSISKLNKSLWTTAIGELDIESLQTWLDLTVVLVGLKALIFHSSSSLDPFYPVRQDYKVWWWWKYL